MTSLQRARLARERATQHGLSDPGSAVGGGTPPKPAPAEEAHWASRLISRGGTGGYTRLVEEPNSPHHLGAYSPTRGEVTSGHVGRGVSSADTAAAKRDARRLRRAREEAFEKTFTILPLDGGALPKTPNPNPSPNPNPNPNPNPKQARCPTWSRCAWT